MDDQFKRPNDLFGFRYGEENDEKQPDREEPHAESSVSRTDSVAQSPEETVYRPSASAHEESYRKPDASYSYGAYGANAGNAGYGSGYGSTGPAGYGGGAGNGGEGGGSPIDLVPTNREYRPFTVSGNIRPPRRRSSLRAMFASFMVGVVAVGGLMFAADRGNWFSGTELGGGSTAQSASAKTVAGSSGSGAVSNAVDTVRPNNISKIFEQASPAVVKIETYQNVQTRGGGGNSLFDDPFFRQFFGDDGSGDGSSNGGDGGTQQQETGMGSGFIFDSTGYILTNEHVVDGASEIKVTVNGYEQQFTAKLLGSSYDLDLAVLKIEGSNFPTLKLGDSNSSNMGDWVVAIGNPYGFDHTVTVGVLSANERKISIQDNNGTRNYEHLLQTDASINPGNSGGPLLNLQGEVIGINTAVSSEAQGIGFAIPTSTISEVLDKLKTNTKIPSKPSPFIGATLQDLNSSIAKELGLNNTNGALVYSILYNSPAYKGDLRQYDVITGMDGKNYKSSSDLIDAIKAKSVGDKVTLNIIRGGKKLDVTIEIGDKNQFEQQQQQ